VHNESHPAEVRAAELPLTHIIVHHFYHFAALDY
jgi:hypothetical protein